MTQYGMFLFTECTDEYCDGIMISKDKGRIVDCRRCTNSFILDKKRKDNRVIGAPVGKKLPQGTKYDDVLDVVRQSSSLRIMEPESTGSLYYSLREGDSCIVKGCNGTLRQTGGRKAKQYSCKKCDFETFEKDVS